MPDDESLTSGVLGGSGLVRSWTTAPSPDGLESCQVRKKCSTLSLWAESTIPSAAIDLNGRTRPLVFTEAVHKRVVRRLGFAVDHGSSLYLQGAVVGVGATVLVREFARQYTDSYRVRGLPDRIVTVRLHRETRSARDLLSTFALALKIRFTAWELRMGDKTLIGEALAAEVRRKRIRAVVFDHVSLAGEGALGLIAEFMLAMNPLYSQSFEADSEPSSPTAVILVDDKVPEVVFGDMPDVLMALGGNHVELSHYRSVENVAEMLRGSGIGLADLNLENPADRAMTECVFSATDGLIANMDSLLNVVNLTARQCAERPGLKHVHGALKYYRRMVNLALDVGDDGAETLALIANRRSRGKTQKQVSQTSSRAASSDGHAGSPKQARPKMSRAAQKAANLKIAEAERADLQRQRDYTVLPGQ